jgi:hypothetical protein
MTTMTAHRGGAHSARHVMPVVRRLCIEVGLVAIVFIAYNLVRLLAAQDVSGAFHTANGVWELERWLNLPSEQSLQALSLDWPKVVEAANLYYIAFHFPVIVGTLLWLFFARPPGYTWCRNALFASAAVALVLYTLVPVAPPRLMDSLGFVDTGNVYGLSVYGPDSEGSLANQFAAMPSLHVGWALIVAVVLIKTSRTRWRFLWSLHPVLTLLVVVITANHYWLDGLVGAVLVTLALVVTRRSAHTRALKPAPKHQVIDLTEAEERVAA